MKECADRLGIKRGKTNELLRAAMCVELLSKEGEVGSLSFTSIRWFRLLIIRPFKGTQIRRNRKTSEGISEIDVFERWVIRPECPWAKKLFRQAVEESWISEKVYQTIRDRMGGIGLKRLKEESTRYSREPSEDFNPNYAIRNATVKDAAEMILEMISHSQDPVVLRRILQERLNTSS